MSYLPRTIVNRCTPSMTKECKEKLAQLKSPKKAGVCPWYLSEGCPLREAIEDGQK